MPHHHAQHVQNMGPNLFTCNENSAYVMPHVTTCALTSCVHHAAHACRQATCPYAHLKLLMDMLFARAKYIYQNQPPPILAP